MCLCRKCHSFHNPRPNQYLLPISALQDRNLPARCMVEVTDRTSDSRLGCHGQIVSTLECWGYVWRFCGSRVRKLMFRRNNRWHHQSTTKKKTRGIPRVYINSWEYPCSCTMNMKFSVWGIWPHLPGFPLASFQAFPPSSFWSLAVCKNRGGRPGPFYHVNDASVYMGRQSGVPDRKNKLEPLSCSFCPIHWSFQHLRSKKCIASGSKRRTCAQNAFFQLGTPHPLWHIASCLGCIIGARLNEG